MTAQEAIKILYKMPNRVPLQVFTDDMAKEIDEMIQVAQVALEKQIAKKPNYWTDDRKDYYFCPNCKYEDGVKEKQCCCDVCGQALKW